jgi:ubiquinone/menaquinone biosynthesis C-methylase UbiE
MDHHDHVNLLRPADLSPGASFADLGAGSGAFTLALRELLGPSADIYAVDRDRGRLAELERAYRARFGDAGNLHIIVADFYRELATSIPLRAQTDSAQHLPPLDGALMANSLHFFRNKEKVLQHVNSFLKPNGMLLLVEYNVDRGNPWVPHPLSFETFRELAPRAGFSEPRLLAKHPSSFLHEFYSALACKLGK